MNSHWSILLVLGVLISEYDDRTDRLALVHQVEALVDLLQRQDVGDHRVDLDLAVHVPVDDLGHVEAHPVLERLAKGGGADAPVAGEPARGALHPHAEL